MPHLSAGTSASWMAAPGLTYHRAAGSGGDRAEAAGLFTAYGVQRPSLLREWAAGADTDGERLRPLDEDLAWQAELWRRLRSSVGVDSPWANGSLRGILARGCGTSRPWWWTCRRRFSVSGRPG